MTQLFTLKEICLTTKLAWAQLKDCIELAGIKPEVHVGGRALYGADAVDAAHKFRAEIDARKVDPEFQRRKAAQLMAARDAWHAKRRAQALDNLMVNTDAQPAWLPTLQTKLDRLQITMDMVLEVLTRPQLEKTDD